MYQRLDEPSSHLMMAMAPGSYHRGCLQSGHIDPLPGCRCRCYQRVDAFPVLLETPGKHTTNHSQRRSRHRSIVAVAGFSGHPLHHPVGPKGRSFAFQVMWREDAGSVVEEARPECEGDEAQIFLDSASWPWLQSPFRPIARTWQPGTPPKHSEGCRRHRAPDVFRLGGGKSSGDCSMPRDCSRSRKSCRVGCTWCRSWLIELGVSKEFPNGNIIVPVTIVSVSEICSQHLLTLVSATMNS